jgi:Domain of unknown function (DUF4153)
MTKEAPMDERSRSDHPAWPVRAALLAALGAAFGFLCDALIGGSQGSTWPDSPFRVAGAAFLAVSGLVFAVSLERRRWTWSAGFAAACGLLAAFVAGWNGSPNGWGAGEGWQFFSGLLAVAIAVPLFQSCRDGDGRRSATAVVHAHVWTNLVLGAAACAFVGATILLTVLLAQLFHLIGIDFLRDLMNESAFMWTLACAAFGGAVGLLRDRDEVLGTLHKLGRAVLSVLAPVLALGLVLFVLALPFTGLQPLWDQTEATTPILLVCILGSVLLVNAAIGNSTDEEARSPLVRYAALGLVPVMLPLAFVAAVSTAKRIGQYGLTPGRLWACVFVLAAAAFALAYLHALVRGRAGWPEALRRANVRVAAGLCLLALFLALPIVSFGAISAGDQSARLRSGRVTPDRFDWAAMRFDFGPPGRKALERLAAGPDRVIRQRAREALRASSRWAIGTGEPPPPPPPPVAVNSPRPRNRSEGAADITPALKDLIDRTRQCSERPCRVVFVEPGRAVVLRPDCADCRIYMFEGRPDGTWEQKLPPVPIASTSRPRFDTANGRVEVRRVERRQVFVGGQPVGEAFE